MERYCETCRFYSDGLCKRYAPRPVVIPDPRRMELPPEVPPEHRERSRQIPPAMVLWPPVAPDDHCYEWEG